MRMWFILDCLRRCATYRRIVDACERSRAARLLILGAVPLAWLAIAHIAPLVQMLAISFYDRYPPRPGAEPAFTFRHYLSFLEQPLYYDAFIRSFVFATVMTAVTLVLAFPVAYYIAKVAAPRWRIRLLLILLMPFWISEIVRSFAWIVMLGNRGGVNALLMWGGLIDEPIPILYTYISLGIGVTYLSSLYMLLPLYASVEKIKDSLLHAAADLGASPFRRFLRIILPLSRDGIVAGCMLVFLLSIGLYGMPQLLGGPDTTLFAVSIGQVFARAGDSWPQGGAFSVILLASALIFIGMFARIVRRSRPIEVAP